MTQPNVHVRTSLSPEWDLSWWLWRLDVTAFSEWRPGTHATIPCELPPSYQAVPQVKNSVSWAWNLTPLLHVTRKHFTQFRETPTFPGMWPSREPERKLHVVSSKCHQGLSIVSRNRAISGNPAQSAAVTHPTLAGQRELLVAAFTTLLAWALAVLEAAAPEHLHVGDESYIWLL